MWNRWLALCFVVACGGVPPPVAEPLPSARVEPTGLRVMMLPRPTPNVVRLSLWIDAGSRDATPPQLATMSAWVAARTGGADVHVRVLPDGTEFWIECASSEIEDAVTQLARTLATRATDADTLTALRQRLLTERAGHELNGRHVAEANALIAALGAEVANHLLPLGSTGDDADVTDERVAHFLADHFGPNRALLVAVGDARADVLDRAIGTHFAGLAAGRTIRENRSLALNTAATRARVERATESWAATAIVGDDQNAVSVALKSVAQPWATQSADARWLPVRGGTIGLLVTPSDDPIGAVHEAILALSESHVDPTTAPPRVHEDLAAVSERAGVSFCVQPNSAAQTESITRIGYGVALKDEVRAGPEVEARAQQRVETAQQEIFATIERTSRPPAFRGSVGTDAAQVVLNNGARIAVRRRASHNVGIAIRFLGGASEEHRTSHGRTAVLALLSAQACEGLGSGALITRLHLLGATLTPTLDPDSFGLRLTAPAVHWQASLDLLTRCALRPLLNRRVLRDAQARMLATLGEDGAHGHAAVVAERLAATHPGTIAPWGGTSSVLLDLDAVGRAHAQAAVGARVAITVVGDVPVDAVVTAAARRLSSLLPGALPLTPELDHEPPNVGALSGEAESPSAVLMFHLKEPVADELVARGFAALLAEELSRTPSIKVRWLDAGAWSQGAWAAIGIELPVETLEQLNMIVDHARNTLASPAGRARTEALMQHAVRQASRNLAEPVHEADLRARRMVEGESLGSRPDHIARAFEQFLRSEPHYLVSRGRPRVAPVQANESRP